MPPHRSRTTLLGTLTTLTTLVSAMSGIFAKQTALAKTDRKTGAAWRATSRLGYGPTAASAQAAQTNPRAWALQQVDAAYAASKSAPYIPADINRFNQPLGDIARDYRA